MVEVVCLSSKVAQALQDSVQWQLLMKHLDREGIAASVWVEGEERPVFIQMPEHSKPD